MSVQAHPRTDRLAVAAALWSVADALLHAAIGELATLRVAANVVVVVAAVVVVLLDARIATRWTTGVLLVALAETATLDVTWVVVTSHAPAPAVVLMSGPLVLLAADVVRRLRRGGDHTHGRRRWRGWALIAVVSVATVGICALTVVTSLGHAITAQLYDGRLVAADYYTEQPEILSATMGFDGIIGLPDLSQASVEAAGGGYASTLDCADPGSITDQQRSSAAASDGIGRAFVLADDNTTIDHADGLPVVFSWPVRSDTIDPGEFQLTLSDGEVVHPQAAGIVPNWELNERQTVVLFGQFGNRLTGPGAVYPTRLDMVDAGGRSLMLAGPQGDLPATGLHLTMDHSGYGQGPTLVAAKLTRSDPEHAGEGGVILLGGQTMPNDETTLYGDQAQYRLRLLTTGGFTPDGVRGLHPDDFARYFRLEAAGPDGRPVLLTQTGVDYHVLGGTVRVVGLSDLGQPTGAAGYDDCYQEDQDNQIDVVLAGDEAAMRSLRQVDMPGLQHGYGALYNPGGPGPDPQPGVVYTKPSPPLQLPITQALDDPMQVTRD